MAHYAKILNGKVITVITAESDFFETFIDSTPGQWIQTSYNTHGGVHYDPLTGEPSADQSKALRKNFAGIGYDYDAVNDAFISPKPHDSWILDPESFLWNPPVPKPETGNWTWNEETVSWIVYG